ncbi:MAG: radical SAM protein [Clostridia bacterium]|nr:radical SAM protein [Clostridia bacterium]
MDFKPITAVWEITMGCNMRCKHCGSSCEDALEGELTTEEALKLCKDLSKLGFQWITISGGEPTTRKDWHLIAKGLSDNGIIPNMITNGWLMNEEIAQKAKDAGINTIAFSVDGLRDTHDYIRRDGSYDKIMLAIDILVKKGINCAAITTVNNKNINELREMRKVFVEKGVGNWQLQLGLPMGNMAVHKDLLAEPSHMNIIVDFAHETSLTGDIIIDLADCIGYFNKKEIETRTRTRGLEGYGWDGCAAGRHGMGILHNGDIIGCTSLRDKEFIEGNIRKTSIEEIWNSPTSFLWNRQLKKDKLTGFCRKCMHGNLCKGGCANTRLTFGGNIYASNDFCLYSNAVNVAKVQLQQMESVEEMLKKARKFADHKSFQLAGVLLEKILEKQPNHLEALSLYGYVSFMMENYQDAKAANEKILQAKPEDAYANKGFGLSIARLGEVEQGIRYLEKAILLGGDTFLDPYHDLAVLYLENERLDEAISTLKAGMAKSNEFAEASSEFMNYLMECSCQRDNS